MSIDLSPFAEYKAAARLCNSEQLSGICTSPPTPALLTIYLMPYRMPLDEEGYSEGNGGLQSVSKRVYREG